MDTKSRYMIVLILIGATVAIAQPMKPQLGSQLNCEHPLAAGLVAYWPMNEGGGQAIYDLSGNNNTGTITNAVWRPAKFGNGLYFDGTGDYAKIEPCPDSLKFVGGKFTVVAWIYPQEDAFNIICGNDQNTSSGGWAFAQYTTGSLLLYIASAFKQSTTNILTLNAWNQVVVTYDNSIKICRFYVNGVFINQPSAFAYNLGYTAGRPFAIGIDPRNYAGQEYNGLIDNVMIYKRALTASEIAQLYREPFCIFREAA